MEWTQIIVLAIVQGITEFLPISSSAHLILVPEVLGWPDQGIAFDVALHIGSVSAVLWYFRQDLFPLWQDWLTSVKQRQQVGESFLAWAVLLGTIPVGFAGLLLHDTVSHWRSPLVIVTTTIIFGILLGIADWQNHKQHARRSETQLDWRAVIFIGLAQVLALIPGTSRSGITMTAALFLGYSRTASARYSFLLSIPVILLAGSLETVKLFTTEQAIDWAAIISGVVLSAISAYLCIVGFIALLNRLGMLPFVIYRLVLGGVIIVIFFF